MQLIIVESPTKAKTIAKFLGPSYKVLSSYGHLRDLPKGEFGVDLEQDFTPKYVIPMKSKKVVKALKEEAKKTEKVILATDEDREGEAIAWHITKALGLEDSKQKVERIVFHEITKDAIKKALTTPREIDTNRVHAQQARRILDRIVGYKLSPFLWKKVARHLSAGRVQSVTVRLVVEREREIQGFKPQEYWSIEAALRKLHDKAREFHAQLIKEDGKTLEKFEIQTKKEADKIAEDLHNAEYRVSGIERKEVKKNPLPPFTTSTLQQEAWGRFKLPAKVTMRIAQNLYERGFITYHRTDSLNLSEIALFSAKKFITAKYGKEYWAGFLRKYKAKGRVQEAHEAIRPTFPNNTPEQLQEKAKLEEGNLRLYDLIWRRFIASQMSQAVFNSIAVDIVAKTYTFRANGQTIKFDGFLKVYPTKFEENELPTLEKEEVLELVTLTPAQHFTQPPARYTEASLIKTLEEHGIGRPSTYAPILSLIQERNYVEKNPERRFQPTEIGTVVNDLLVTHFPNIVDIQFTRVMEDDLDEIAAGEKEWVKTLRNFYDPFAENLKQKYEEVSKKDIAEETTTKKCPKCGSPIIIKLGKFGKFYACSTFPKCKYTESLPQNKLGVKCPKCEEGEVVGKRTRTGKLFYGCNRFPKCDFALWDKPTGEKCPTCDSLLIETKRKQIKCSNKECGYVVPKDQKK